MNNKNDNIYENNWIKTGEIPTDFKVYEIKDFINKKNLKIGMLISVLIFIFILLFINLIKKPENTVVQEKKLENNIIINLENGYVKKSEQNEQYNVYIDRVFNFYCAIPKDYKISNSGDSVNRAVLKNKDSSILIFIGATENKFNLTIKELLEQYVSSLGKVDYKANGDNWYVVSKYYNGISYYKKTFIKEGKILWFEFNIKDDPDKNSKKKKDVEELIEFIEDNFNIMQVSHFPSWFFSI